MKKILAMFTIVMAIMTISTGCITTIGDGKSETSISGNIPKLGSTIYIHNVIGRETLGPYETIIVWECIEGDVGVGGVKTVTTRGFCFSGLDVKDQKGYYIVGKDRDVNIRLYQISK